MFKLQFSTSNDEFRGNEWFDAMSLLEALVPDIAGCIEIGEHSGKIEDTNGNTIGSWEFTPEQEDSP